MVGTLTIDSRSQVELDLDGPLWFIGIRAEAATSLG